MLHYWQTTQDDFDQAVRDGASTPAPTTVLGDQKGGQTFRDTNGHLKSSCRQKSPFSILKNAVFEPTDKKSEAGTGGRADLKGGWNWALQDSNL